MKNCVSKKLSTPLLTVMAQMWPLVIFSFPAWQKASFIPPDPTL